MKKNRLKIIMESRIHGDVYVRFGGEYVETYRPKGRQGAMCLACGYYREGDKDTLLRWPYGYDYRK